MAIGSLPPVISEIQANSGQPGKTLAQQTASSLLDVQAAATIEPATAILPETTLIEKAVAEALGRQGGLAPLYASLSKLAATPDLPEALKTAVNTVLAFRIGDGDITPARVAEAIRSSGLFHEAVAAGKMAAVLPPAVRQALGVTPEEKRQVLARVAGSASSPVPLAPAARSALAIPASAPPLAGRPSMAAPPYAGQGGAAAALPIPTNTPASGAAGVAAPPAMPAASAQPATTSTGLLAAPSATPAMPPSGGTISSPSTMVPSEGAALAMGQSSQNGVAPGISQVTTVATTALLAVGLVAEDGSVPPQDPALPQAPVAREAGGSSTPQPVGRAGASSPSPASPLSAPATVATQPVSSPTPASGSAAQSSLPTVPSTSDPQESGVPGPPLPAGASLPSAGPAPSSRAFAPFTLGRPLAPTPLPLTTSASPAAGPPSNVERGSPLAAAVPTGGDTILHRSPGDRTPFVPSTMDSLPNAPAEPAASPRVAGLAISPTLREAQTQPGIAQPSGSALPAQSESASAAGPGASPLPQAPSQARPAPTIGAEPLASSARQSASLASAVTAPATPPPGGADLKGALDVLRRELVAWLGRNADVMASIDGSSDDPTVTRVDRPSPPRKGGPVRGQPAVRLPDGGEAESASAEALAGRALGEAERSLSRVFLHQAATAEGRDMKAAQPTQALMLEIPIAGPNGTSIAQLRIERDDRAPTEPGAPPRRVFQVDIAFDIAPLGPVAVRVGLMDGRRVAVGVWCESDDGLVRMEAERENIVLGLEQEGMVVAGVDLHRGHPPEGRDEMAVASSHRLDLQL